MTFTKCWCFYTMHSVNDTSPSTHKEIMNFAFVNRSKETAIYPLAVKEIAEAQTKDETLEKLTQLEKCKHYLVENTQVLCKDGKLVIPKELQQHTVDLYHDYLQHP